MILKVLNKEAERLIPLDSFKEDYLRVDFDEDDKLICDFIDRSVEDVEGYIQYPVVKSDVLIQLHTQGTMLADIDSIKGYWRFQSMNVNSLTSIKKTNNSGDEILLVEGEDYRYDARLGTIYWLNDIEIERNGYCYIEIECNVGWDATDLPAAIKMSIIELASTYYDIREIDIPLPKSIRNVLAKYRHLV